MTDSPKDVVEAAFRYYRSQDHDAAFPLYADEFTFLKEQRLLPSAPLEVRCVDRGSVVAGRAVPRAPLGSCRTVPDFAGPA